MLNLCNTRTNYICHLRRLGKTYKQIGELYGFSGSRARQLVVTAERKERDEIRKIVKERQRYMGSEHVTLGVTLWCANEIANG